MELHDWVELGIRLSIAVAAQVFSRLPRTKKRCKTRRKSNSSK
ncbi:hypothetical protein ACGFIF_44235 [Kribbella sp. NPDC049174]